MADKKISALTAATTPLAGTEVLPIVQSSATVKVSVANLTAGRTPSMNGALIGATASAVSGYNLVNSGNAYFAGTPIATNGALLTFRDASATGSNTTLGGVQFTSSPGNDYFIGKASVNADGFLDIGNANTGATYFRVDNTGNVAVKTAAKGVNFTANTPAAGMTSQLLNWYEEGTWTPTLVAAGVNFTSVTYDAVTGGRYTRIGNVVHIQGRLRTDAVTVGSASGDVCIGNLPFTAVANGGSTSNGASAISIGYVAANWAANRAPISGQVAANTTQIELYYRSAVDGTCVNLVPADVGTGADANTVYFAGTYIVS